MNQTSKKGKKKRKLKIGRILIALLVLCLIIFGIFMLLNTKIKNIEIKEGKFISESTIFSTLYQDNYATFLSTSPSKIKEKLMKKYPIIKDVKVRKSLTKVTIEVIEYRILFIYKDEFILENKAKLKTADYDYSAPFLSEKEPMTEEIYNKLIEKSLLLEDSFLSRVSEITYAPNDVKDRERFYYTMIDGNYVYITLSKIEKANLYDTFKPEFEGKTGTLYLDSHREGDKGYYFDIFK